MFHKALWMWNWKRGKYAVLLFFFSSLYLLSFGYYKAAELQLANYYRLQEKGTFYYYYEFWSKTGNSFWLTFLIICLACLFIGWERNNQSNALLTMPFTRKDIFFSKWAFGSFWIIVSLLVNWGLMYVIYRTTIHFDYQSFSPFHRYFLYAIVSYVAVYTTALCIGTFTGSLVSQVVFCIPWLLMGLTFISLAYNLTIQHLDAIAPKNNDLYQQLYEINQKTNIVAPIYRFSITYDYDPVSRKKERKRPNYFKRSSILSILFG